LTTNSRHSGDMDHDVSLFPIPHCATQTDTDSVMCALEDCAILESL